MTQTLSPDEIEFAAAHVEAVKEDETGAKMHLSTLGALLQREFGQAENDRRMTEERWLKDIRQYRGKYDPDVERSIGNRSKAFVRKTRVKVKTVDSRVADLLFPAGSEKNWSCDPTPKPSIAEDSRRQIAAQLAQASGGQPPSQQALDEAVLAVARESAKRMTKTIEDQLIEARYKDACVKAVHSGNLYGTGVLKGPLVERKVRTRFRHVVKTVMGAGGQPTQVQAWEQYNESYVVPFVDYVPLWRFYPDMAATTLDQCRYVYERHSMAKHEVLALTKRKSFDAQKIVDYVKANPDGSVVARYYDNELKSIGEREATQASAFGQYEVLERWGWIDGQHLKDAGVDVPEARIHETFFSNVWMLPGGCVIKAAIQPINGVTWPYHMYYFDKDETSIFGEGLASIMRDDQEMLNAAVRLMIDNAAISSGPQLEIAVGLLSAMENVDEIVPWKVWKRNRESPGQRAIHVVDLPSRVNELSAMAQMFEANADEVTAIPRYMTGENATTGAAGTAAGMSMLMAAANIVIKDLITSWDEGVTRPFIQAMYSWNMQFNQDNSIKGDYDVKARGTASLVAKEVRARQLNEFAAMASDPQDAPFIKRHKLLLQRAEANELSDAVKTEDEVKAEQESEQAKQAADLQQQLVQAQLKEAQGRAEKIVAEAEVARRKSEEILANIDLLVAKKVSEKVSAVYAALQAGGVATNSPYTAPAGDEILQSSGWEDENGDPTVAMLNGPPVQQLQGTQQLVGRGQSFQTQPRGTTTVEADVAAAQSQQQPSAGQPQPATGMVGVQHGIETTRID